MFDVTAFGEILIDFTPAAPSETGNICFERNPGGGVANVAACVSKLGGNSAFIGKVGKDIFGAYLKEVLDEYKINSDGFKISESVNTTLAFVQLNSDGERSFSFYRNPGADTTLTVEEVDFEIIAKSKIFHHGSLSLTNEPSKTATLAAIKFAKEKGCTISYDPNLRLNLWPSPNAAKKGILSVIQYADILKVSEEELEFLTGETNLELGSYLLFQKYNTPLILVTLGSKGCFFRFKDICNQHPAYNHLKVVDTTGAGDSFIGSFLYMMTKYKVSKPADFTPEQINTALAFANATGALCITKKGGIPAMPSLEEVQELQNNQTRG